MYRMAAEALRISIHALLAESDSGHNPASSSMSRFQSTLSLRRATVESLGGLLAGEFQSTLSLRRATTTDWSTGGSFAFQSTLSLRRATIFAFVETIAGRYFNPRSPCGERLQFRAGRPTPRGISIHALLAESDTGRSGGTVRGAISIHALLAESDWSPLASTVDPSSFQSTLSLRRATDQADYADLDNPDDFNPRSPCGERQGIVVIPRN